MALVSESQAFSPCVVHLYGNFCLKKDQRGFSGLNSLFLSVAYDTSDIINSSYSLAGNSTSPVQMLPSVRVNLTFAYRG
jgi:hypothetical protein